MSCKKFKGAFVSTKIIKAINKLGNTIDKLDNIAGKQEQKVLELKQQDLFGGSVSAPKTSVANDGASNIDMSLMASKIDSAIANIEKVLEDG